MDERLKEIYVRQNDIWGDPQIYKSVKFYPLLLKDSEYIDIFYSIFQFAKNYIPNKKILKMSYLKFMFFVIQYNINPDGTEIRDKLVKYLKYCTKSENVEYELIYPETLGEGDFIDGITIKLRINDIEFNEQDFEIIRGIILEQNGLSIEYVESFNPELEKTLNRLSETGELKDTTLEDEIFTFASLMNKTVQEIQNYTFYSFKKHLLRLMYLLDYKLINPLEISGQISSKNGNKIVKHYLTHISEQGRYDSILISADEFLNNNPDIPDEHGRTVSSMKKNS